MIVTTGTTYREAKEPSANHINPIINDVVWIAIEHPAKRQKPHTGQIGIMRRQTHLISSNLLSHKLVERLVFIKGADDIVAIGIRERANPSIVIH